MNMRIGVIRGDGIGPEIVAQALRVLDAVLLKNGHTVQYTELALGGDSIDRYGVPLTEETLAKAGEMDAILMGSIGGDTNTSPWYKLPPEKRPEAGLLAIRKGLGLFANLRPASCYAELSAASPLKESLLAKGFDILIVRELTGGLYFGERGTEAKDGVLTAHDRCDYSETEIRRVARKAFEAARVRQGRLTQVDKANVLDTSRLWRRTVTEMAAEYPDVHLSHMLVDNCAMQLVKDPGQFDVILTENLFGDILSDEASVLTGSLGMLPSASLAEGSFGLYEPTHGSAPDIAGQNVANPLATVLSAAMMLRYSFGLETEARAIEEAVAAVIREGIRTRDLILPGSDIVPVSCSEMGDAVLRALG